MLTVVVGVLIAFLIVGLLRSLLAPRRPTFEGMVKAELEKRRDVP